MHDAATRVVAMVGEADSSLPISHLAQGTVLVFFCYHVCDCESRQHPAADAPPPSALSHWLLREHPSDAA